MESLQLSAKKGRLGLLTFHRCINYGSYWQTRCLVGALERRGWEVEVIDHFSPSVQSREWRCALAPVSQERRTEDRAAYRRKVEAFGCAIEELPLSRQFDLHDPSGMPEYDVILVGSDEVWNLAHPWYGQCPLFYGDGLKAARRVAYAASFGNFSASWGLHPWWAGKLTQFESISVRDLNSRKLLRDSLGIHPAMVVDPCLLDSEPLPCPASSEGGGVLGGYVAVYGHEFSPEFIEGVCGFAEARRLPTVSIGYRNDWADMQVLDAGPHEFARLVRDSAAMATNFFHGCVFALKEQKPFVAETMPYRAIKVRDLLRMLGATDRLAKRAADYERCLSHTPELDVSETLECLRVRSEATLDHALT